jgi:deoxyribodipyrimidine photo-lyase
MKRVLVWLRRDLRGEDHSALAHAASLGRPCALAFVKEEGCNERQDAFIRGALHDLNAKLRKRGAHLLYREGNAVTEIPQLAHSLGADLVLAHEDYEPEGKRRDENVKRELAAQGVELLLLPDHVIFPGTSLRNQAGQPYRVFTPYAKAWRAKLRQGDYEVRSTNGLRLVPRKDLPPSGEVPAAGGGVAGASTHALASSRALGSTGAATAHARLEAFRTQLPDYAQARNFPARNATSELSPHLRFGTLSTRACVRAALSSQSVGAQAWLKELIWRDFFHMILDQFPHVAKISFRAEYEEIRWPGSSTHFEAWREGRTGFPLVDAAMRQLRETGWMHNRLRMVVASFFCKDLLLDWRLGAEYFASQLVDHDLAANLGGWQWCASTGCDAQPWFRIFHPVNQSRKFDPDGRFIRTWVPELAQLPTREIHEPALETRGTYPLPLVSHAVQRKRALALFQKGCA